MQNRHKTDGSEGASPGEIELLVTGWRGGGRLRLLDKLLDYVRTNILLHPQSSTLPASSTSARTSLNPGVDTCAQTVPVQLRVRVGECR